MRSKLIVGLICLFSATTLVGCQPSQSLDAAASAPAPEPAPLEATPPVEAAVAETPVPARKTVPNNTGVRKPVVARAVAPIKTAPVMAEPEPENVPLIESQPVAVRQDDGEPIAATVSGCLIRDDGVFQLKDTDGEYAPKSRSWKSGFIRKSPARIDVIDAGNRLALGTHVGHRVSVSGTLVDREMHVRALRPTSEPCD
jgi:hypothetical protein